MPISTNVTNLKINELTEAQYDSAVQGGVIGANELSILTDVDAGQVIQVATLPTASADELDNIYQFVGTTDANYTNGYFYKCVSDGQQPATYSWSRVDVQPGGLVNTATGIGSLSIQGNASSQGNSINIGYLSTAAAGKSVSIGQGSRVGSSGGVAVGKDASCNGGGVSIGFATYASGTHSIQIGGSGLNNGYVNSDANTVKFGNANGNYEIMSADGTIPSDRLIHAINKYSTMPTAASTNEGWIVQFTGTTDSTYTHGHLYECVSDGGNPATYSWTEVQLGGGGSSYTAGTGIDITSGVISVTSPTLTNTATGTNALTVLGTATTGTGSINIGVNSECGSYASVALGYAAKAYRNSISIGNGANGNSSFSVAIGYNSYSGAEYAIQLGTGQNGGNCTNNETKTFKVALGGTTNYKLLDSDGTIPTDRLTKVNTTVTLAVSDWSSNTQTVNVTGMTATGVVMVSPDPTDQSAYTSNGILCTAQAAGTLTFTCSTTPSAAIDVNVVML